MEKNLFYQVMILVLQVLPSPVHVIGHEEEGRVVVAVPGKKPKRASTGSLDCVNRKSRLRHPMAFMLVRIIPPASVVMATGFFSHTLFN